MVVLLDKLKDLGVSNFCHEFYNGEDALKHAKEKIFNTYTNEKEWNQGAIMPVCLMILDLQMPKLNGIQVIDKIREYIKNLNKRGELQVLEPIFALHTAFASKALRNQY